MSCHTRNICTVSLRCELCCAPSGYMVLRIVCCKQYIQTVSPLNEFVCVLLYPVYMYFHNIAYVLLEPVHIHNICHILCTCIYLCEYTYDYTRHNETNNVSYIECMNSSFLQSVGEHSKSFSQHTNTALACHHVNAQCDYCYQLQSLLHTNFHLHNMHNKVRYS